MADRLNAHVRFDPAPKRMEQQRHDERAGERYQAESNDEDSGPHVEAFDGTRWSLPIRTSGMLAPLTKGMLIRSTTS